MTTLGTDSRPITLPADEPVLVTDNLHAPVQVLNLGAARLYMGSSSAVSPNNGAPVEPGTAQTWRNRQLWLTSPLVDGSARVSDSATGYTPSPEALAAASATALAQSGVFTTATLSVLASVVLNPGDPLPSLDVSAWASLLLIMSAGTFWIGGSAPVCVAYQAGVTGKLWTADVIASVSGDPVTLALPVSYGLLTGSNVGDFVANLTVVGSSRAVPDVALVSSNRGTPRRLSANSGIAVIPAGTLRTFLPADAGPYATTFDRAMSGSIYAAAAGTLSFSAATPDGAVTRYDVAHVPAGTLVPLSLIQPKQGVTWGWRGDTDGPHDATLILWAT